MYQFINVLLADNHELLRDGFKDMLKKSKKLKLVGEAMDGKELIAEARRLKPDVIVTDIQMPVMDGIEATRLLTAELPHIGILALSMSNNPSQVMEMMEAGAKGYVIKDADKVEIMAAIEAVYEGSTIFCRDTTERLDKSKEQIERDQVRKSQEPKFSDKEITIIKMICAQDSNKQIAGKMGLSIRTIEWYRDGILQKMSAKNVAGIAIYAVKHLFNPSSDPELFK